MTAKTFFFLSFSHLLLTVVLHVSRNPLFVFDLIEIRNNIPEKCYERGCQNL